MKPIQHKNYGSIPHLSNSNAVQDSDHYANEGQQNILTKKARKYDNIIVTEKYDGSNVGITKIDGKIMALTRSGYQASTSPHKNHHIFAEWVKLNEHKFNDLLDEGERIVGEWLMQVHGTKYIIRDTKNPIVFFDYFNENNERYIYDAVKYACNRLQMRYARILHEGQHITPEKLVNVLNERTEGIRALTPPEGMVYRCENNGTVDFLAKWVRPNFVPGKYMLDEIFNATEKEILTRI